MLDIQPMTLWDLPRNQKAIVDKLPSTIEPKYIQRLIDLGLREGEEIYCRRRSFLGGPRVYQVGNQFLALEKSLATHIVIKNFI